MTDSPSPHDEFHHVAICGVSYCGSTLLALILGSLPGVGNIGESHWLGARRENGVTVPADPANEDWNLQVPCFSCGRSCVVLDRDFRVGLLADPRDWYQKIATRLDTSRLVSADKNRSKILKNDPELRLTALVLFKSPTQALYSHLHHTQRKSLSTSSTAVDPQEPRRYLDRWARSYGDLLDRFEVTGTKVFVDWDRLCARPAATIEALCDAVDLPFEPRVLERFEPMQHCLGGNSRVHRDFRQSSVVRFEPPREIHLLPEQEAIVREHRASTEAYSRIVDVALDV